MKRSNRSYGLAVVIVLIVSGLVLSAGCSRAHYRDSADQEAYRILSQKQKAALGSDEPFTIEQVDWDPLAGLPRQFQPLTPEAIGAQEPEGEAPAIVSVTKALEIAIRNSREYQRRKEDLYLAALDLSLDRHRWTPIFSSMLSGKWQRVDGEESWVGNGDFGVSQLLASGATFTLDLGSAFLSQITGGSNRSAESILSATLIQPLWRGASRRVATENLTQSERDVIYAVRSFARYHKVFAVDIVSGVYAILQQRDVIQNEWHNYQRLTRGRERAEALAGAGRMNEYEVDQARQDELRAKDRWIRAEQRYRELLDQFKIDLGLPTDANVDVDVADLEHLRKVGLVHPDVNADDAVLQALALRLDLANAEDSVVDAERRVAVAANGLAPDVDLVLAASAGTEGDSKPAKFRFERGSYSAGLNLDLPLNRKSERNTYRAALITFDRQRRNAEEAADNIKQQVRQAWRSLQEARESYAIQRNSLALADRRVTSTAMLLEAGRASTRDVLESQAALLDAQNALTRVLVDHTLARLRLWRDMGTLVVNSDHAIEEKRLDDEMVSQATE